MLHRVVVVAPQGPSPLLLLLLHQLLLPAALQPRVPQPPALQARQVPQVNLPLAHACLKAHTNIRSKEAALMSSLLQTGKAGRQD
jgi:hypothetical protein